MQLVILPILFAAVACFDLSSAILSDILPSSAAPSFSDADDLSSGSPVRSTPSSLPSISQSASETPTITPTTAVETCDNPPCSVIVIQMNDNHPNRTDLQKSVDERFGDRVVRWLVVAKTTHIDKMEEIVDDFATGKKKKVSSENRFEQFQMMRDSRHAFSGNEFDLVSVFK